MSNSELPILTSAGGRERELGALLLNNGNKKIPLPLAAVDIDAKVVNQIAHVNIKQTFHNDCTEHLEAVYIFPLAPGSAVFSFIMKVGDRVIKGIVKERGEARMQYQQAVSEGKRAALMEQERDDVFTVQVGNLPPGEDITVEISYSEKLPFFETGYNELRLPLVVGPRYTPGNAVNRQNVGDGIDNDTDIVPDASRISPPRLYVGEKSGTRLSLNVEILPEKKVEIQNLSCSQYATKTGTASDRINISLARVDEKLNRDFVLRWTTAGQKIKTSLLQYTNAERETFGMLSILPPRRDGYLGAARDVVFVIDRSGSMGGTKMVSARRACKILLNTLGARDSFNIAAFDDVMEWMDNNSNQFVNADAHGIEKGEKYLNTIDVRGGTNMDCAFQDSIAAIARVSKKKDRLPVIVLLTDGQVSNESQIVQRVQKQIGDTRLFIIGICTAVNGGLLERLARIGGGRAAMVEPGAQLEDALVSISQEIGAPVITDLQVSYTDKRNEEPSAIAPARIPDLFAGRASVCFFQFEAGRKLVVRGKYADGGSFEEKLESQKVEMPALAQLWAKAHIVDKEDEFRISNPNQQALIKKEIIKLSVSHSILTKFTAFVVVDESEIVNKTGSLIKAVQAVELPAEWDMYNDSSVSLAPTMRMKRCMSADPMSMHDAQMSGSFGAMRHMSAPMQPSAAPQPGTPPTRPAMQQGGTGSSTANFAKQESSKSRFERKDLNSYAGKPAFDSFAPNSNASGQSGSAPRADLASSAKALFEKIYNYIHFLGSKKHRGDLVTVGALIAEFFNQFELAYNEVNAGSLPDARKLESIRTKLVQGLAPLELGLELPLLQRFLRTSAIELISTVNDRTITMPALKAFWQSKQPEFNEIRQETENLLSGKEPAFWDSSV